MALYRTYEQYMSTLPTMLYGSINDESQRLRSTTEAAGFDIELPKQFGSLVEGYEDPLQNEGLIGDNFLAFSALFKYMPKNTIHRDRAELRSGAKIYEDETDWIAIGKVPIISTAQTTWTRPVVIQYAKAVMWSRRNFIPFKDKHDPNNIVAIGYSTNFLVANPPAVDSLMELTGNTDAVWNEHIAHPAPAMLSRNIFKSTELVCGRGYGSVKVGVTQSQLEDTVLVANAVCNALVNRNS